MACTHRTEDEEPCPECTCEDCGDGHLICDCAEDQLNCECCEHDEADYAVDE